MARPAPEAANPLEPILSKVRQHYRLGVALLLAGFAIDLWCFGWGLLTGGVSGQSLGGFVIYLIEAAGFALILAGAVFFVESRAFLRRNSRVA